MTHATLAKPDYVPTGTNWPVDKESVKPFNLALKGNVFQPLNVFFLDRGRVNPNDFDDILPGAIVEVKFCIYTWHFKQKNLDFFNAKVNQLTILRPSLIAQEQGGGPGASLASVHEAVDKSVLGDHQPELPGAKMAEGERGHGLKRALDDLSSSSHDTLPGNESDGSSDEDVGRSLIGASQPVKERVNETNGKPDSSDGQPHHS